MQARVNFQADAEQALVQFNQKLIYHQVQASLETHRQYARRGRPSLEDHQQVIQQKVLNLSPDHLQIIRLLGPQVQNCYLCQFEVWNMG